MNKKLQSNNEQGRVKKQTFKKSDRRKQNALYATAKWQCIALDKNKMIKISLWSTEMQMYLEQIQRSRLSRS